MLLGLIMEALCIMFGMFMFRNLLSFSRIHRFYVGKFGKISYERLVVYMELATSMTIVDGIDCQEIVKLA